MIYKEVKMYIHLYSLDTWGFVEDPIDIEKDIKLSEEEKAELIKNLKEGRYYIVSNPEATSLSELLKEIEVKKIEEPKTPLELLQEEMLAHTEDTIDLDFRLTSLELGL